MEEGEVHIQYLQNICRVCGVWVKKHGKDAGKSKDNFAQELRGLFAIDVNADEPNIHGQMICAADKKTCERFRDVQSKGKVYSTNKKPYEFKNHNAHCSICQQGQASEKVLKGRPAKRKHVQNDETDEETDQSSVTKLISQYRALSSSNQTLFIDEFVKFLDPSALSHLAYQLGASQQGNIFESTLGLTGIGNDFDELLQLNLNDFVTECNNVVTHFISGCTGKSMTAPSTAFAFAQTVEQIYKLRNLKMVGPVSFLQNLTAYISSGSKQSVNVMSASNAGGSYTTLRKTMLKVPEAPIKFPTGTLLNVFDNQQVIGRKRNVHPDQKAKLSIITTMGYVLLEDPTSSSGKVQTKQHYRPKCWFHLSGLREKLDDLMEQELFEDAVICEAEIAEYKYTIDSILRQESNYHINLETVHYHQLYYFVDKAIKDVMSSQKMLDNHLKDDIDLQLTTTDTVETITCPNCGAENSEKWLVCRGCKDRDGLRTEKQRRKLEKINKAVRPRSSTTCPVFRKITFEVNPDDHCVQIKDQGVAEECERYDHIASGHKCKKQLVLTEPAFCNPNSSERVAVVLRKIGTENGITRYRKDDRVWTFVCCDGLPYNICLKLMEEAVVCDLDDCGEKFLKKQDFIKHHHRAHTGNPKFYNEFDWFYLKIGMGHYEMNLIKSFFELNWLPFLETLAETMGFTSDAAKNFAHQCKDHHIAWQLLLVFHLGTLRELVLPYCRHCIETQTQDKASAIGYFNFCKDSLQIDPTYRYVQEQICRYSQAIINLRMGIRRNNAELVHSAKYMSKELFFGRNHPKYQQIEVFDTLQYHSMPQAVKNVYDENMSLTSGGSSAGQDADFKLEEGNKDIKSFIPKGELPSNELWKNLCVNHGKLKEVHSKGQELLNIASHDHNSSELKHTQLNDAILAWRKLLRESGYLDGSMEAHISLKMKPLHKDLVNFTEKATKRRMYFICNNLLNDPLIKDQPELRHPVYLNDEEFSHYNNIENQTKAEIIGKINSHISELEDPQHTLFTEELSALSRTSAIKQKYVELYMAVREVLDDMESQDSCDLTEQDGD